MKRIIMMLCAAVSLALVLTPAVYAQSNQIVPGTQVRLRLINGLSTSVAHDGDPFTAVVTEPVFMGSEVVLPAGAKVHGTITTCPGSGATRWYFAANARKRWRELSSATLSLRSRFSSCCFSIPA